MRMCSLLVDKALRSIVDPAHQVKEGEESVSERLVKEFKKLGYVGTAGGHIKLHHVGEVKVRFDVQQVTPAKVLDHTEEDDKKRRLADSLSADAKNREPKKEGILKFLVPRPRGLQPPAQPQAAKKDKEVDLDEAARKLFPRNPKKKYTPPKPAGEPKQQGGRSATLMRERRRRNVRQCLIVRRICKCEVRE